MRPWGDSPSLFEEGTRLGCGVGQQAARDSGSRGSGLGGGGGKGEKREVF
jgi:hypothetical protein